MKRNQYGVYEITLAPVNGAPAIPHNSKVKVRRRTRQVLLVAAALFIICCLFSSTLKISMTLPNNERIYRLPAWINRVTQDLALSPTYEAIFWNPDHKYVFKNPRPKRPESLRIYEAHGKTRGETMLWLTFFSSIHA